MKKIEKQDPKNLPFMVKTFPAQITEMIKNQVGN